MNQTQMFGNKKQTQATLHSVNMKLSDCCPVKIPCMTKERVIIAATSIHLLWVLIGSHF